MSSMKRVKYGERKSNARWTPKRNDARCQRGQQIRCKMLVGSVRCPLVTKFPLAARALPKFGFSEFTCDDALFQLSTAINHGQHVVPVGALTPFVHLLASEQLGLLRLLPKWVNASRWRIMTVHHLSRFTDANPPPCLTFSHATCCP